MHRFFLIRVHPQPVLSITWAQKGGTVHEKHRKNNKLFHVLPWDRATSWVRQNLSPKFAFPGPLLTKWPAMQVPRVRLCLLQKSMLCAFLVASLLLAPFSLVHYSFYMHFEHEMRARKNVHDFFAMAGHIRWSTPRRARFQRGLWHSIHLTKHPGATTRRGKDGLCHYSHESFEDCIHSDTG